MTINWNRYPNNEWCNLYTLDLSQSHFEHMTGVYIIWNSLHLTVVYVGKGYIRDRLYSHRNDNRFIWHENSDLYVTWAYVEPDFQDGVESYLANTLNPEIGEHVAQTKPISVNLPWPAKLAT